jgi:uncharacterized membrane protein SpoIIM required for sporulation/uncharacterized RDD family membrane protein YckC
MTAPQAPPARPLRARSERGGRAGQPDALDTRVEIETPELVTLQFSVAGLGSRGAAALIDGLIVLVLLAAVSAVGLSALFSNIGRAAGPWVLALLLLAQFAVVWGYYVLFEWLRDGQTPGKRWLGLRVVQDGGFSVGFTHAAVRNLLRLVDAQPGVLYAVGMIAALVSRRGKRLGDLVAGTIVVRERTATLPARAATTSAAVSAARGPLLDDESFALVERLVARRATLDAGRVRELERRVAERVRPSLEVLARDAGDLPHRAPGVRAQLERLLAHERAARAAGGAVAGATGARREQHAIVAQGAERWQAFAAALVRVRRRGLAALDESEVGAFVHDYRDVAADLARLRTALGGRESDDALRLGRLVAEGHNLLYRRERLPVGGARRLLTRTLPAEVRRSAAPILIAAALLFGPGIIAGVAVWQRPALAREFIPSAMRARADEGVERARRGTGYIEDPGLFRPVMASSIVANNVQVTFGVFALGVTAGLGTTAMLVFNGVHIGGLFGLFASKGILSLLLAFVAPHGVLELSAIAIAGGAGLLLGGAVLVPGARTRADALVEDGRRAVRLIVVSTMLLVVAGTLEGMVSPIPHWPLSAKLAVAAVTAVALAFYLALGRETLRETPRETRRGVPPLTSRRAT